jgi:hypothetical protein
MYGKHGSGVLESMKLLKVKMARLTQTLEAQVEAHGGVKSALLELIA